MNSLTSQQRKIAYLIGIVLMGIPIIWLGIPAAGEDAPGGQLAQLRVRYDLGESTLGDVDPTSATMNLVLLGLRGVATNLLWMDANHQQETKNWGQLRSDVESIIKLQPHFLKVWLFQGWNLAYNVSAQWDAVPDRYYWVKEGSKFLLQGTLKNTRSPRLHHETGRILGHKIGRADEWRDFRKYFREDPDTEKWDGGPDLELNPENRDNYLVAKQRYTIANDVDRIHRQMMMMAPAFRQYAARSQLEYAVARQREGKFDEVTRIGWEQGYRDWTEGFGQDFLRSPVGGIQLEATRKQVNIWAEERKIDPSSIHRFINEYKSIINYDYWVIRALSESEEETVLAHRDLYEGRELFKAADLTKAQVRLFSGMEKIEKLIENHPELSNEDNTVEEALMGVLFWKSILEIKKLTPPRDYPLRELWESRPDLIPALIQEFERETTE